MTTTLPEAASHVVVSHGADFFGQDRHTLKALASLAEYAEGTLTYDERGPVVQLLRDPAGRPAIPADEAAQLSELLLKVSRNRFVKPKPSALARALADAAARAATADELWQWDLETVS